jgi:glycosyltransferase involved in cell wall biosynthesis
VIIEPLPFVSVVVPIRNVERTLADCLRSLLRVDYPVEQRAILVVDYGSTDDTDRIISRFQSPRWLSLTAGPRPPATARSRTIVSNKRD